MKRGRQNTGHGPVFCPEFQALELATSNRLRLRY